VLRFRAEESGVRVEVVLRVFGSCLYGGSRLELGDAWRRPAGLGGQSHGFSPSGCGAGVSLALLSVVLFSSSSSDTRSREVPST